MCIRNVWERVTGTGYSVYNKMKKMTYPLHLPRFSLVLSMFFSGIFISEVVCCTLYRHHGKTFERSLHTKYFLEETIFHFNIHYKYCTIIYHRWASASIPMSSASAFRHPVSQSCTGAVRYRAVSPYSGTGLVSALAFLFIPESDCPDARHPAFRQFKMLAAERDTPARMLKNHK
jgi:hypothetical protein